MSDAEELPVVVNPRAGAGKAQRRLPTLVATLQAHGARPVVHPTEGPGHATELVRDLLRGGAPGVAVVGGDGTMKGACKIDAEMSKRGKKCVVCCVPKTRYN